MADASKRGSRLVLAFVLVASVAVIFAWHSRPVPRQGWRTILEEPGVPAARRGMELSRRGRQLLSPHERQVFAALSQSGAEASARDLEHSATLIQKSVHSLSPEKQDRLFGLIEKAVRLQYEKEQGER